MTPFHQPLYRIILRINWLVIAVIAIAQLCRIFLFHVPLKGELISLTLVAVLALVAPMVAKIDLPMLRFACGLFELLACTMAACFGVGRLYPILFVTILARYSMLVSMPALVILVFLAALPNNQYSFMLLRRIVFQLSKVHEPVILLDPFSSVAGTVIFVAAMILLVVAIRYLNIEQDSRKQAQRLMLEIKDMATELERSRLAREIHDSLGHSLTALNMQLEVFATLHKTDPQKAMEAFHTARRLATDILDDVRAVVHSIRHQDFQFEPSLRSLIDQSKRLKDTEIKLELEAPDIPKGSAYQLYSIARECLTNSLKHAAPRSIALAVHEEDERIVLTCTDDGAGFNPAQCNGNGYGLRGMKERAESLGGTLTVESSPGRGTKIVVAVPKMQISNDSHSHS